jgi:xanthine dehydrogenase accessory factor
MSEEVLRSLLEAREERRPCVLVTVAATAGSVPRQAGAKMLVFGDGGTAGTIGGGKFEALVIEECARALRDRSPQLKTYPLHELAEDSFGAICGGEVTVLIEPQQSGEAIFLVGAGHCSRAIAGLARSCGLYVTVVDDRPGLLNDFPAHQRITDRSPAKFIMDRMWRADEALIIASRNYEIDREALRATLARNGAGYVGMIGSRRKVRRVFDELIADGVTADRLAHVFAPMGLDVGADAPEEIAISVLAEVLQVMRGRPGGHLRGK